jgi:glucokinase
MLALAGDIGGTKTRLGVFSPGQGPRTPLAEETFASSRYPSLEAIVQEFLSRVDLRVDHATFGVAGPVVGGQAKVTNLPWRMDERQLRDALGFSSVRLMNDLEAIANGVPSLEPDDLHTLNAVEPSAGGAIAIIAPGTGLGEAYLTWSGSRYLAHPSEGGHAEFAPVNELEIGLLRYMLERFEHASYERVCSGIGIPNIYAYLRDSGYAEEPAWLAEELAAADDRTPIIANHAMSGEGACELCTATLSTFVSILGTEAGNLALKILATGGVYLGGGIPPRILPALQDGRFMEAFQDKGRLRPLMERMPVHVILNLQVALLGAACHCLSMPEEGASCAPVARS